MNRGFQRSWWLALIALCIQQAASTGIITVCFLLEINYLYPVLIFGSASLLVPIVIGGIWVVQDGGKVLETVPAKGFSPRIIPYCILLPIMIQQFIGYAMGPVNAVFYILFGTAQDSIPAPDSIGTFILTFIALCIAAPVFEEVLCRGVIMKLLEKYGFLIMVLGSACLFAALHLEIQSILPIFFLGVLFAVIRHATGSIWPSMLMHAANNFLAILSLMLAQSSWAESGGVTIVLISLAILCPFAVWRFLKLLDGPWKENIQMKSGIRIGVSSAMIILIVLIAVFNTAIMANRMISGDMAADLRQLIEETGFTAGRG